MAQDGRISNIHMKFITAAVLLVLMAVLVACETETGIAKEIADKDPDFVVTAAQIVAEYEASESAADDKYKGKVVLVTGVVILALD